MKTRCHWCAGWSEVEDLTCWDHDSPICPECGLCREAAKEARDLKRLKMEEKVR